MRVMSNWQRTAAIPLPRPRTAEEPVFPADRWRWLAWRYLAWTAPEVCLASRLTPSSRLKLALCELFRCQPRWSLAALAARLAASPALAPDRTQGPG